ncbi:MAG: DUF5074 domain-containing protein [Tannerellaceae bacterium]|jgi:uncharacterized protein YjdB|nr:DUF5074 domain-containing protein [Tannerellaceae bacterium]
MINKTIKQFCIAALIALFGPATGNLQATVYTVTTEEDDGEGSLRYFLSDKTTPIQDGDTLTFADHVRNITITKTLQYKPKPRDEIALTVLGNGVCISGKKLEWGIGTNAAKALIMENIHFKNNAELCFGAIAASISNATFTAEDGNACNVIIRALLVDIRHTAVLKACSFTGEGQGNIRIQEQMRPSPKSSTLYVDYISCTFKTGNQDNSGGNLIYKSIYEKKAVFTSFTNCVLIDHNYGATAPTIEDENFQSHGYNVLLGTVNGPWSESPAWKHGSDVLVQPSQGTTDPDAGLQWDEGIYKAIVNGPAYKHLPANTQIEGIAFPPYDLAGHAVDYTQAAHSGAWQAVYGEEDGGTVYPETLTLGGATPGQEIYSESTLQLSAGVGPNGCEQAVTWESSDESIATIDANGLATLLPTTATENKEVTFTATTVAVDREGNPLRASLTIVVKPYIHVTGFAFTIDTDTVRSLWNVVFNLNTGHAPAIVPGNALNQTYTWSIDDNEVATLAYNNARKSYTLTGRKAGRVTLKATPEDNPSLADSCVYIFHDPYYSDVKGVFLLTEGVFTGTGGEGVGCGDLHFIHEETGIWDTHIYETINSQKTGTTTQFGAIYGDHFFLISKQANRVVVADKTTVAQQKSFKHIHNGDIVMDGRAFLGVDENTGYVGTSAGIAMVKFDELLSAEPDPTVMYPNVVQELPYTLIEGTATDENLYTGQVGTMLRVGDRVFAVQQNTGILVIDALTHHVDTVLTGHYANLAQSLDGYLWSGTSEYESTGQLADDVSGNIIDRIDPYTLEIKKIILPDGIGGPTPSWGAWQADVFCASAQKNQLYWTNAIGGFGGGTKIYQYDIDSETIREVFDAAQYPDPAGYSDVNWKMYGCPFRVHPETDELYVAITTWPGSSPALWNTIKVNPQTKETVDIPIPPGTAVFNDLWIFPDNQAPAISAGLDNISLREETRIYLGDRVTDADNPDAAIIKSVILKEGEELIAARIWRDSLIVTPLKKVAEDTQTTFTLKVNSNGKVVTKTIAVTVNADAAITEYPFELTAGKVTIRPGDEYRLALTAAEHYPDVRWSSSHPEVATVTTGGVVKGIAHGIANIIVKDANSVKADTCMVTVIAPGAATADSITLNTALLIMNVKETAGLSVVLVSGSLTGKTVKWSTSNAAVADVTSGGKVLATGMGSATITASAGEVKAVCTVMVRDIAVNAEASSIGDKAATVTFPKMLSAAYYLAHVYEMVNGRRQALITLKINAEGEVDIAYALRAATNDISVTLSTLKPATEYEVDVEVVRVQNNIAEVISTLATRFKTKANATSAGPSASAPATVSYANGTLCAQNLEGYRCRLIAISGQTVKSFTVNTPNEFHSLALPQGVYILDAEKNGERKIFKLITR